jgi:uncharacterized protein YbjT (DUF2867 family)
MREPTATVAVCGATGRQGSAVTRHLLERGFAVRALTRKPDGPRAKALTALGATAVGADMNDAGSLQSAFEGVYGVYSVQNGIAYGFEAEVEQGRNVGRAAKAAGVAHVVYGSAGTGQAGSGIPSWESKVRVEERLRALELPLTILRPTAFMELMTDKSFYPAVGTWRIWPRLSGEQRPISWLALDDLGAIAAIAFADRDAWVGRDLTLAADVRSLAECRSIYREVMGRDPKTMPMPEWLFDRFTRRDVTTMWRWLGANDDQFPTAETRAVLPEALTVREWLARQS